MTGFRHLIGCILSNRLLYVSLCRLVMCVPTERVAVLIVILLPTDFSCVFCCVGAVDRFCVVFSMLLNFLLVSLQLI